MTVMMKKAYTTGNFQLLNTAVTKNMVILATKSVNNVCHCLTFLPCCFL